MSQTKHTPGPWSLGSVQGPEYGEPEVVQSWVRATPQDKYLDGLVVASVVSDCIPEALANAKLIAAAPDLLEALEHCLDALLAEYGYQVARDVTVNMARAAIARAKGEPLNPA